MSNPPGPRAIHASFFFVDIVGLSESSISTALQVKKIEFLNKSIAACNSFKNVAQDSALVLPTGDGMAIGFLQGPEIPLLLAIELHKKIRAYNKGKLPKEAIQVRIGIHSGSAFVVKDIRGNSNIWGPGIIMARRIMDIGDEQHILLSSRVADDLSQLSSEYFQILHPLERYAVKHNVSIMVYSAYGKDFGNPRLPAKIKSRINEFLYPFVEVRLTIVDPKSMLVYHKRTYDIQNMGDHPTSTVTHQIATDVEKTFDDLKIRVYDERQKPLRISSIEFDTLQQKEFATSFPTPLSKGSRTRYYLEYLVEEPERYFENMFFTNCKEFVLVFEYPRNAATNQKIKAAFYDVDPEKDTKHLSKVRAKVATKGSQTIQSWRLINVSKGRCVRIEW